MAVSTGNGLTFPPVNKASKTLFETYLHLFSASLFTLGLLLY